MVPVCNPGSPKAEAKAAQERVLRPAQASQAGACSSGV